MDEMANMPLFAGRDEHLQNPASRQTTVKQPQDSSKLRQTNDHGIDPDTCRICRGEGTVEEPLFYPCKCSGSIKYVHQDCLMEWLSHSQKKHCELCKTPFRFTKLYSPQMPNTIPVHVFIGHVAKYLLRNMLTWLRAGLVITVWLCWLPGLMRSVWAFLFWVSDEGVGVSPFWGPNSHSASSPPAPGTELASAVAPTCPANPFVTIAQAAGGLEEIMRKYSGAPYSGSWHGVNISTNDTVSAAVMRATLDSLSAANNELAGTCPALSHRHPLNRSSLLSGVSFLQNLSRYPFVNRTVVNVLEGQIITILVIVSFILVILVRDYVVQQQPEINMRAALEELRVREERLRLMEQQLDAMQATLPNAEQATAPIAEAATVAGPEPEPEPVDAGSGSASNGHVVAGAHAGPERDSHSATPLQSSVSNLDNLDPDRSRLAPGGGPEPESPVATVHEYLRLYRQEGGDPRKILKAIEDEDLEDSLGYWARVTRSMIEKQDGEVGESSQQAGPDIQLNHLPSPLAPAPSANTNQATPPSAPHFSWPPEDAWEDLSDHSDGVATSPAPSNNKGKEKEVSHDTVPQWPRADGLLDTDTPTSTPLRPRAVSDGPQRSESVHPLANNSWSFAALPDQKAETSKHDEANIASEDPTSDAHGDHDDQQARLDDNSTIASDTVSTPRSVIDAEPAEGVAPADEAMEALGPQPLPPDMQAQRPQLHRGMMDRIADFMWGDLEARELEVGPEVNAAVDDEHADHHLHEPEDFVDADDDIHSDEDEDEEEEADDDAEEVVRDPEVVEAAAAAGLDPEAVDDAEDIEGVLELIGMRGPLIGLFQNAIFCSVLVSVTIFICVFLPYNLGRFSIWSAMNPSKLLNMIFGLTKFVQDAVVAMTASACSGLLALVYYAGKAFPTWLPAAQRSCQALMAHTWSIGHNATSRVADTIAHDFPIPSSVDVPTFSALSHQALIDLKSCIAAVFFGVVQVVSVVFHGGLPSKLYQAITWVSSHRAVLASALHDVPRILLRPSSWVISIGTSISPVAVSMDLVVWSGSDRFWAILCGYFSLCAIGALYLRRGSPLSSNPVAQEWEASLIDVLNQASGVMKVILIISIEMLVFPLYCGLLLDAALLPLFENATMKSRLVFTIQYPLTSIFVHWFVGTGYMFHFALFVSMCRKIMRKGVLYFIRDPDDPEFHPVRDVLERNVTTQLRKILFSAFVYGALVIVCLGGVVWSLSTLSNVLPIHYSSNEPILEFPIDLLFYNFAMPLAVKFFRPSDGLHIMYTWWLRKCARFLRLSWFLFGERRIDEEGQMVLRPDSPHWKLPWWRRFFLELNKKNEVVPKTWNDLFEGGKAKPTATISSNKMRAFVVEKRHLVRSGQLIKDGSFVRTPSSDQVKIPKGRRVFLPVNEHGQRINEDGTVNDTFTDPAEEEAYTKDSYQLAYIPPNFRYRMFMFILLIWIFAAVTGVGFTILPLVFGRKVFQAIIPTHVRTNDIYAFSIGVYILGSATYLAFHARSIAKTTKAWCRATMAAACESSAPKNVAGGIWRAAKVVYTYFMLLVVFPLLAATLVELYFIIPIHTYINPPTPYAAAAADAAALPIRHTAHVVQSWTLGLLYVKLAARALTGLQPASRAAQAVRAVFRRGWTHPDAAVLTRAFVIPGLLVASFAICAPVYVTGIMERRGTLGTPPPPPHELIFIYRLSYPAAAINTLAALVSWSIFGVVSSWKTRIRDEAYLIGERLHNFGVTTAGAGSGAAAGSWRVHGGRV